MAQQAPGKHYRKGISLIEVTRKFPDDLAAEAWFVETRWPNGVTCPSCDSDNVLTVKTRKPQPYRCRACRKHFSVKTGTLMQGSKLGLQVWAMAYYLLATGLKGTASMKLHRDLGVTQKTAWHLAHRIRETWAGQQTAPFNGPVEADETAIGGLEKNKHADKRQRAGRGTVGKAIVAGVKDRTTNRVSAAVVRTTTRRELQAFIAERVAPQAMIYTDDAYGYRGLPHHQAVTHAVAQYVDGEAHTNGLESFWAMMKRGYHGTYHKMSPKHLDRYVREFEGRHNERPLDTLDQMAIMVRNAQGKRLRYRDLIAANGLKSGARKVAGA